MRLKTILPLLVILLAILGAFALLATRKTVTPSPAERRLPSVPVMTVAEQSVQLMVNSQGTVAPRTESQLIPEVSGPVVWMSPSLVTGGYFLKGDVLARIDPSRYQSALQRALASVERTKGEYQYALATLERQKKLAEDKIVSPIRYEEAQRGESVTQANLRDAEAVLDDAQRDLERCEIRAPFEGRVRDEAVDLGQYLNRGSNFATLYATDYLEVRLPVADDQLAFFADPIWLRNNNAPRPKVRLHARFAGSEHNWWGEVVRTEGEIDPGSRMVHVIARVLNPVQGGDSTPLPVGLFVQAEIEARYEDRVFVLPRAALYESTKVIVVDEEDRLRLREVEILRLDRDEMIVSSGVETGERIAVSAPAEVIDGAQVAPFVRGQREIDS
jgi:RND family efflux transporter MFP subunit